MTETVQPTRLMRLRAMAEQVAQSPNEAAIAARMLGEMEEVVHVKPSPGMQFFVQLDTAGPAPPTTYKKVVNEVDGSVSFVALPAPPRPPGQQRWHKVIDVVDIGFERGMTDDGMSIVGGRRMMLTGCGIKVRNDPVITDRQSDWGTRLNEAASDPWSYRTRCHKAGCWPVIPKEERHGATALRSGSGRRPSHRDQDVQGGRAHHGAAGDPAGDDGLRQVVRGRRPPNQRG